MQTRTQHRQELDQARYNRQVKLAPLLSGERVLIHNFRSRVKGKLNLKWSPEPFVVVSSCEKAIQSMYLYYVPPDGKEALTRTVHRNNLKPFPLNVLRDSQVPGMTGPVAIDQTDALPLTLQWDQEPYPMSWANPLYVAHRELIWEYPQLGTAQSSWSGQPLFKWRGGNVKRLQGREQRSSRFK